MAYVYRHIRTDINKVFYVGIGSDIKGKYKRAKSKDRNNPHWKNIINKTDYKIEILFDDISWEEACEKEVEFIKLYGREDQKKGTLVNLTDGGDGCVGLIQSEEHRKKRSDSLTGRSLSEETKLKMGESRKGRTSPNKGKKLSEEHRRNLGLSRLGVKRPKEVGEKVSQSKKGVIPKRIKCPHCPKEGSITTMKRWHFDNCKLKVN